MLLSQKIPFKGGQLTLLSQRILTEVSFLDECYLAVWELDLTVFRSHQIYWDHVWLAQMMILFLLQHLREDRKIWALRTGEAEVGTTTLIKKNGTKEKRKTLTCETHIASWDQPHWPYEGYIWTQDISEEEELQEWPGLGDGLLPPQTKCCSCNKSPRL